MTANLPTASPTQAELNAPKAATTDRAVPAPSVQTAKPIGRSVWKPVLGWLIVAGMAGGAWQFRSKWLPLLEPLMRAQKAQAPKGGRVVPVTTDVVRTRDMPIYLNGLGTVTSFKTVTIRSRVDGELVNVDYSEGEVVKEGKVLANIDPRQFKVQLDQAEGQLSRNQAILKSAQQTLTRYEGLFASKSIAAQLVEEQSAMVLQTMASIQSDQASVANAKLQLDYCRITAPISGRIGLRLVDQGNIVRANDPNGLAVITQLQPIALIFTIPQDDIARVQRQAGGQRLHVDAFDREFKERLATGYLLAIDNQVDATTGTVRLKAEFENKDGMLFPNQFVNARLLIDTKRDAIVVKSAAVQRGPSSMFVYVVQGIEDGVGTVEQRNIKTGPSDDKETSIVSGLSPGEIVVIDGLDKLQPKSKVALPKPADKPASEKTREPAPSKDAKPDSDSAPKAQPQPTSTDQSAPPKTAGQESVPHDSTAAGADSKSKVSTSCGDPESVDPPKDRLSKDSP